MNYYIVGIDENKGNHTDDSSNLMSYFELGWEIMTTHIEIKKLLFDNNIKKPYTVVTCEGRQFLYENDFDNVITWGEYKEKKIKENSINLCLKFYSDLTNLEKITVSNDKNFINLLGSFKKTKLTNLNINEKYACLVYRKRIHDSHRNINDLLFEKIIRFFTQNKKIRVFVVGFGSEKFEKINNCHSVKLNEFATLISNKNCKLCFSTLTGPPSMTYLFGHENLKNIIVDLENARNSDYMKNHPLAMGDRYNYKKVETFFIEGSNNEKEIFDKINMII